MSLSAQKATLKSYLQENGFSTFNAELWAEFVRQVLIIYWQAADQLLSPDYWEKFKGKLGAMGAPKKSQNYQTRSPLEDAITSEIGHLARGLRQGLAPNHFLRKHEVEFNCEALIYSEKRAGRYSKVADFRVTSNFRNAPELVIEAKPLKSESDIGKRYLAEEGMGCFFLQDSAYTNGPLGAMLAYTFSLDDISMREPILNGLKEYKPEAISIKRVTVPGVEEIDCSYHDRSNWKLIPITILHLERCFPLDVKEIG